MNRSHLALAGAVVVALSACSSTTTVVVAGTVRPTNPASSSSSPAVPTIGPSIPAQGPFGVWWSQPNGNATEGRGQYTADVRSGDLGAIAQDEANGDDNALSSDGTKLATDMSQANADPSPYDTSDYQHAMTDYIQAGNDYANGDATSGDTELQSANTTYARWGRTVQPYCPEGGDCIDQRSFASPTASP